MMDFASAFTPPARVTSAPTSAAEIDLPPGAPLYPAGPLGTMPAPTPSPTPTRTALTFAAEQDLPPGANGTYYGGPLANPKPSPTPPKLSLNDLAQGGYNHAQAWTAGMAAPPKALEQKPFEPPAPPQVDPTDPMHKFTWSSTYA
jgi:hypothetical protein